ncbi:hypothetical protein CH380_19160 [Leptospira adleri]|uniref:Uncharacterized protein n=2 Tax=Leptospira adleri TaxID=2023186 RepID=A0A2M9YJ51_9LEPT|nr:hypothetical protein CH380_19160 [Leptospira adleri]PJZ61922.1 hypothetical protein CH376_11005 [Leptospira adleri]
MAGNESSTPTSSENKESFLEKFITEKEELSRYSMAHTFRVFCTQNFKKFNELKTENDIKNAFELFFHGREPKEESKAPATLESKGGLK